MSDQQDRLIEYQPGTTFPGTIGLTVDEFDPGRAQLYVDGTLEASAEFPHTTPLFFELEGLSCGYDAGAPVMDGAWESPFEFSGTLHQVVVDISGELIADEEATLRQLMAGQ